MKIITYILSCDQYRDIIQEYNLVHFGICLVLPRDKEVLLIIGNLDETIFIFMLVMKVK